MSTFELKQCPVCRGSGQYCTTYPKHFSPCGECNGTGKVRTYAEWLRPHYEAEHHKTNICKHCGRKGSDHSAATEFACPLTEKITP